MTRDPARIDPILADLRRYWHAAPDLRLGQMVMGLLDLSGAPRYGEFNAEDDKVAAYLAAWAAANPPPPDHRDAEIARLRALRDRYFAAAVATADAIDGGSLGPVRSGGESDAEFQAECARFAESLPARAAKVRAELANIDSALRDCYALARAKLARESRPGGWVDIVRFCERASIKASPLRSAEARDAAKADVPTPPPEIEAAITAAGQALVDAWDSAQSGPPHRFAVYTDPEGDPEVAAGWMAMARMHAAALAAAREAGRQEAMAERLVDGGPDLTLAVLRFAAGAIDSAEFGAVVAADKARAVELARADAASEIAAARAEALAECQLAEQLRPMLSQAEAERLIGDFNASPYDGSDDCPARAALLAALTGIGNSK